MKRPPLPRTTRMIRLPEVMAICGLSRSTVYAYTKRGEFPARVKITRHASAWVREEVLAWVESRIHASRSCTPTPAENRGTGVCPLKEEVCWRTGLQKQQRPVRRLA
ncbi:helix-turn-helix transcriptional regulator [Duganella rhizosphaerae]|uniref:helix-turn-helix transcriptional regulator n=1 Tax=Duganella rhizosphaerae TaxID=2885763 RepID=UPI00403FABFB